MPAKRKSVVPAPPAKPLARATSSASNKLNTSNKFVPRNPQYAAKPVVTTRTSLPVKPRVAASSAAPARTMKPRISVNTQAAANPRVKLLERQLASDKPTIIKPAINKHRSFLNKSSSVTPGLKPRANNLNKRFSRLDASSQRSNDGQSDAGQKLDLANLLDQHKEKKLIKVGGNSLNSSLNAPVRPKVALSEVAGRASFIGKGLGNR